MIFFIAALLIAAAFLIGFKLGAKKATDVYSSQIKDIIAIALSTQLQEGSDDGGR